ncbi:hypothetical protein EMCRGX_G018355 [Ephydatia muelleri]
MAERIREKVFRRWCNSFLLPTGMCMEDLSLDVKDGVKLGRLVELLSKKSIPSLSETPSQQKKIQNIDALLVFLKSSEGMVHVTTSRDDILQGDVKAISSLIWSLIIQYQIAPLLPGKWTSISQSVRDVVNSKLLPDNQVNNFTSDWMDGTVLAMLAKEQLQLMWDQKELDILEAAEKYLKVPKIIFYEELQSPDIDEESVMTYATLFLTKMAHHSSSGHFVTLKNQCVIKNNGTVTENNLFVKVKTGTASIPITNERITSWAENTILNSEIDSIEITISNSSGEIVARPQYTTNTVLTSNIKVEVQFIGFSTFPICSTINTIFEYIAKDTNSSIYFSVTEQYLDTQMWPNPTCGWVDPVSLTV